MRHRRGEGAATRMRTPPPLPLLLPLWAVAVALVALLHCAVSPAAAASNIQPLPVATKINLIGSGSLLVQPFFKQAVTAYRLVSPNVTISVQFGGAGADLQAQTLAGLHDFGVFPAGLRLTSQLRDQHPDILQAPLVALQIVPVYWLGAFLPANSPPVKFSQQVLARILRGDIRRWDHAALVALNPFLAAAAVNITVWGAAEGAFAHMMMDTVLRWTCRGDPLVAATLGCSARTYAPANVPYAALRLASDPARAVYDIVGVAGSIAFSTLTAAQATSGVSVGSIRTGAGVDLTASVTATQLPLYERGLQLDADGNADLTTAQSPLAWPMTQLQQLQFSAQFTRVDCATKAELAKFLIWLYESPIVADLASQVHMVVLPSLLGEPLGVGSMLRQALQCGGAASFPAAMSQAARVEGSTAVAKLVPYLLDFYASLDSSVSYSWNPVSFVPARLNVLSGASAAAFLPSRFKEPDDPVESSMVQYVPMWLTAPQATFALPDAVRNYPGLLPMRIDLDTLAMVFTAQISSWLDERLLLLNPLLAPAIAAAGMDPRVTVIVCCGDPNDALVATNLLAGALRPSKIYAQSVLGLAGLPVVFSRLFYPSNPGGVRYLFAHDERDMAAMSVGVRGSIGYSLQSSNSTDDATVFRLVPWRGTGTDLRTSLPPRADSIKPLPANMLACISGPVRTQLSQPDNMAILDFQQVWMHMDAGTTEPALPPDCYPMSRLMTVGIPRAYSGAACDRGNATLRMLRWMATEPTVAVGAAVAGLARVADQPAARAAFLSILEAVTCNGKTLLVRTPIRWRMDASLSAFGIALSSIGIVVVVVAAALVWRLRERSVFRSASVLFLLLMLLGMALILVAALLWSIRDPTPPICHAFNWLTQIGFTLTFAPLFIKTWRIYYIFERRQLRVVKLSNAKLSLFVVAAIVFDLVVLSVWQRDAPFSTTTLSEERNGEEHRYEHCAPTQEGAPYFFLMMGTKMLSLLFGACIAMATRNVAALFNESASVAMAIWGVCFMTIVLVAVMLLLASTGNALIALVLALLLWVAGQTFAFMFVSKFAQLPEFKRFLRGAAGQAGGEDDGAGAGGSTASFQSGNSGMGGGGGGGGSSGNFGGFTFLNLAQLGTATLQRYILECERHMAQAKKLFLRLGGPSSFFYALRSGETGPGAGVGVGSRIGGAGGGGGGGGSGGHSGGLGPARRRMVALGAYRSNMEEPSQLEVDNNEHDNEVSRVQQSHAQAQALQAQGHAGDHTDRGHLHAHWGTAPSRPHSPGGGAEPSRTVSRMDAHETADDLSPHAHPASASQGHSANTQAARLRLLAADRSHSAGTVPTSISPQHLHVNGPTKRAPGTMHASHH